MHATGTILAIIFAVISGTQSKILVIHSVEHFVTVVLDERTNVYLHPNSSREIDVGDNFEANIWAAMGYVSPDQLGIEPSNPVTLVNLTFDIPIDVGNVDRYQISLSAGYNMEFSVEPLNPVPGWGDCVKVACQVPLDECPPEFQVIAGNSVVACEPGAEIYQQHCPEADTDFMCMSDSYLITVNHDIY